MKGMHTSANLNIRNDGKEILREVLNTIWITGYQNFGLYNVAKSNILIRSKKAKASELYNNNKLREADALYVSICQSLPADAESWAMRGLIHRKLGAFGQAEDFCRRAIKIRPNYAWGYHVLGSALQSQGRIPGALACYRKAISLQPGLAVGVVQVRLDVRRAGPVRI